MSIKRHRSTYREIFLNKLREVTGSEQRLISNDSLKAKLGWPDDRYARVKDELQRENAIIIGRGYGGTVGLASEPGTKPKSLTLFISYSHKDKILKEELMKHLAPLEKMNLVDAWSDLELKGGDEWKSEIDNKIENADIILLLVSIDFINSKYCYDEEMEKALELQDQKKVVVVPIILRDCLWKSIAPFAKLQALPHDGKSVLSYNNQDRAFTEIAEAIKEMADSIQSSR